jgi:hypothetical protein
MSIKISIYRCNKCHQYFQGESSTVLDHFKGIINDHNMICNGRFKKINEENRRVEYLNNNQFLL